MSLGPEIATLFDAPPGYLDTAAVGVPPRAAVGALARDLESWASGGLDPPGYDRYVDVARASFARLVGVSADDVATGGTVSVFAGLVAASLPPGAEVVVAEGDFTSILFPFLVQRDRGVNVRVVTLDAIADAVTARTTMVVVSAVQSADGTVTDLAALRQAAAAHGAATFIDVTQAAGWLPLDAGAFDYVAGGAYKWLLAPRGVAFLAVGPGRRDELTPINAGWYAGEDPWTSIYGTPLRLARSARRLDTSPAWSCWVGAAESLPLLESIGVEAINAHNVGLANRFRDHIGLPPGNSAMVAVRRPGAAAALGRAGIRAAVRDNAVRASFHLYNSEADADRAADVIAGLPSAPT